MRFMKNTKLTALLLIGSWLFSPSAMAEWMDIKAGVAKAHSPECKPPPRTPEKKYPLQFGIYHATPEFGYFSATQGRAQNVEIKTLVGDQFTLTNSRSNNGLIGLGIYREGYTQAPVDVMFGLNAYFLGPTQVDGTVIQEHLFTNLDYHYSITNYPLYVAAKAVYHPDSPWYRLTAGVGLGPNFIYSGQFRENSLDQGITLPDRAFTSTTSVAFSATFGVGVQLMQLIPKHPVECGYRFFYLGQGTMATLTDQIITHLNTGNNYANAVMCGVVF